MNKIAKFTVAVTGFFLLTVGISANGRAETVFVNGSFETGDYTGWVVVEGEGSNAEDGTWGIAQNEQIINRSDQVYDFFDQIQVTQNSFGLPRTYLASDGISLAIQLQNGGQDHRLFQEVSLPVNATTLSWDMFYDNMSGFFASDQYLAVHIRDLSDNILETLFVTQDSSPLAIPMSNFAFDISTHAGSTVRIDVEMNVHQGYFDAGFDNFRIGLAQEPGDEDASAPPAPVSAPPGWSRSSGKKLGWHEHKKDKEPRGFEEGHKKGWDE